MRVSLDKLKLLWQNYNVDFLHCRYFDDFRLDGRRFSSFEEIVEGDLIFFEENNFREIEVQFNEKFYSILSHEFPLEYRRPYGSFDFITMDRHLDVLNSVSTLSKRKRFLYVIGDIYGTDSITGRPTIMLRHNDPLDYKKWNEIKRFVVKDQKFYYRNSEYAILIFINMRPDAETAFIERFRKNADLAAAIVTRKRDCNIEIAPDFLPEHDTISVTNPTELLKVYIESHARLIIIGENILETYKRSLIAVKQYDKFARMMVVPEINPRAIDHFLTQVRLVYNSDRWSE